MSVSSKQVILITGATGAIGSALASRYAQPKIMLLLQGRNERGLEAIAQTCVQRGAEIKTYSVDLTSRDAVRQWLDQLLESHAIDLAFVNAGMNAHARDGAFIEDWEDVEQLLEVNVRSSLYVAHRCAQGMQLQQRGHIVLISSLAAWFGLPMTPAYSASKAAIKAYGEGLRGQLTGTAVDVTVVMPGYVQSNMCNDMPGPKSFVWTPEKAAKVIQRKLSKAPARIHFPFWLSWGCWWLAVLPATLSHTLLRLFGYTR